MHQQIIALDVGTGCRGCKRLTDVLKSTPPIGRMFSRAVGLLSKRSHSVPTWSRLTPSSRGPKATKRARPLIHDLSYESRWSWCKR
jgi:hypothetical protein